MLCRRRTGLYSLGVTPSSQYGEPHAINQVIALDEDRVGVVVVRRIAETLEVRLRRRGSEIVLQTLGVWSSADIADTAVTDRLAVTLPIPTRSARIIDATIGRAPPSGRRPTPHVDAMLQVWTPVTAVPFPDLCPCKWAGVQWDVSL